MIKGTTKLLGVIGHPIAHSLSPAMHNAAISHLGVDFVYLAFPVKPEDLEVALAGFGAIGLQGFSITIPHKQAILPLLSEVSPIAQAIGAVNTVYLTDKGWCGTNTDVEGFLAPLRRAGTGAPPLQTGENSLKVPLLPPLGGGWGGWGFRGISRFRLESESSGNFGKWRGCEGCCGWMRSIGMCTDSRCWPQRTKFSGISAELG